MRRRFPLRPLTAAQVLASAAGAIPMLAGAVRMETSPFAAFSVIVLVATLAVGAARAALLQPALIYQRTEPDALVPARYIAVMAVVTVVAVAPAAAMLAGMAPVEAAVVGVAAAMPVLYEWARYRAIGTTRRWLVAAGDAIRVVVVSATLLPIVPADPTSFMIVIGVSTVIPLVVIMLRAPRPVTLASYRSYRASASWQTLDFAVGQFVVSAPLIALAGAGADRLIAGARLAQTLLGPLNLAFSAASTNIVADGATDSAHRSAAAVISRGWRASWRLAAAAITVVGTMVLFVWLTGFSLRGVDHDSLLWGLIFVGVVTISTGWAGIHGIVLRVLDHQASVTWVRIGIAAATVGGFAIGYLVGGAQASLACGFLANAVSAPALFVPVAVVHYRRDTQSP